VRLVVGVEVVLQFIYEARELFHAVVDLDARVLYGWMQHCVMNGVGSQFHKLDVEFYALVRLIRDGADLLFLVRRKWILGTLRIRTAGDGEKCSREQQRV
jgi:hypothetical protein